MIDVVVGNVDKAAKQNPQSGGVAAIVIQNKNKTPPFHRSEFMQRVNREACTSSPYTKDETEHIRKLNDRYVPILEPAYKTQDRYDFMEIWWEWFLLYRDNSNYAPSDMYMPPIKNVRAEG